MVYFIISLVVLVVAVLLLRLRIRAEFARGRRLISFQIGRTGPEIDLAEKTGQIRLFGMRVRRFELDKEPEKREKKTKKKALKSERRKKKPGRRERSWLDLTDILPQLLKAGWHYVMGLIRAATVETMEARIAAGLPEPHQTGQLYGYYQASLGAVPSVMSRVRFTPDWSGASFDGSATIAVAVPIYKVVFRTFLLLADLPLIKTIKLAIGKKRGASDG